MTSQLAAAGGERSLEVFEASLAAERAAERHLVRSIVRGIVFGVPVGIAFFIGLLAAAIGDKQAWYVWVSLGGGIGVLAAVLFGVLGGVTLSAHKLDEVDRGVHDG